MESFGRENINVEQTPFLDGLIEKSLFFENGFANGKLSLTVVPSTFKHSKFNEYFMLITSSYLINEVWIAKNFKDNGYQTAFF